MMAEGEMHIKRRYSSMKRSKVRSTRLEAGANPPVKESSSTATGSNFQSKAPSVNSSKAKADVKSDVKSAASVNSALTIEQQLDSAIEKNRKNLAAHVLADWNEWIVILGTIGLTASSSRLKKFPLSTMRRGGLWYVLISFFADLVLFYPLVFLEVTLGKLSRKGVVNVYSLYAPIGKGIGIAVFFMTLAQALGLVYTASSTILHLYQTANNPYDVVMCTRNWHTNQSLCSSPTLDYVKCLNKGRPADGIPQFYMGGTCYKQPRPEGILSSQFYLMDLLHKDSIVITSVIILTVIGLASLGGYRIIGLILVLTTTLGFILSTIVNFKIGFSSDFKSGLHLIYSSSDPRAIFDLDTWREALTYSTVANSLNFMGILSLTSYSARKTNAHFIAVSSTIVNCVLKVFGLTVLICALSTFQEKVPNSRHSYNSNNAEEDYIFGAILEFMSLNGMGPAVPKLFYISNFLLDFASLFGIFIVVGAFVRDTFDHLSLLRQLVIRTGAILAVVATVSGITAIVIETNALPSLDKLVSQSRMISSGLCLIITVFIGKVYGTREFYIDLCEVAQEKRDFRRYFTSLSPLLLNVISTLAPFMLAMLFFMNTVSVDFDNEPHRKWLGIVYIALPFLMLLLAAIYKIVTIRIRDKVFYPAFIPEPEHPSYTRISNSLPREYVEHLHHLQAERRARDKQVATAISYKEPSGRSPSRGASRTHSATDSRLAFLFSDNEVKANKQPSATAVNTALDIKP